MADPTRAHLALTQQMLATWLGIPRSSVALAETGYQSMPPNTGLQDARLVLATLGLVPHPTGAPPPPPAPPPLPLPPLAEQPLAQRRDYCRHHAQRLRYALGKMRQKAAGYEARYPALPALRAWVGPVKNPEREANWLDNLQQDADYQLRYVCGAGPSACSKRAWPAWSAKPSCWPKPWPPRRPLPEAGPGATFTPSFLPSTLAPHG